MAVNVLELGTTIVAARLLAPPDFGLVALTAASALAVPLAELGFGAAIVHERHLDEDLLSAALRLNGASALVTTGLVNPDESASGPLRSP